MRGKIISLTFPVALTIGLFYPFAGILISAGIAWSGIFGRTIPRSLVIYSSLALALLASTIEQKSDVAVYLDYFSSFSDYRDLFAFHHEFGYPLIVWLLSGFASQQAYLIILSFLFFYGMLSLVRQEFDRLTFLLLLLTPAFLQVSLFATRQTFAVMFLIMAFTVARRGFVRYIGAMLFHSYALTFVPLALKRVRSLLSSKAFELTLVFFAAIFPLSASFSLGIILDQLVGISSLDVAKRYSYYDADNVFNSLPLYSPIILFPLAVWGFRMAFCGTIRKEYQPLYGYFLISLFLLIFLRDINNLGTRFGAALVTFAPLFLYIVRKSISRQKVLASSLAGAWCVVYVLQSARWLYKNESGANEILFNHGSIFTFSWLSWFM